MFFASTPSDDQVRALLRVLAETPCTYAEAGLSERELEVAPPGFHLDRYGIELGEGSAVFERACAALARFQNYPPSFTHVVRAPGELARGLRFATVARHLGFASVHPCRVLYVVREEHRFGFGFGTLPGHAERGEERFLVRMEGTHVRYEVQAFSRPDGLLARLGAKVTRAYQRRFQRETLETMRALID